MASAAVGVGPMYYPESSLVLNVPLVFVGMMGCGKSAIGKQVAERLAVPFADSDEAIANRKE